MRQFLILTSLISSILLSCNNESFINDEYPENLVVEGWIKEGDYPVVLLTTSVSVSEETRKVDSLKTHLLNWAKVTISDGEQEVVLTGMYDENYYPPYKYTTVDLKGVQGKTYYIDVSYRTYHATASTTIPSSVELQDIEQHKIEGSDTLWNLTAVFTDPPGRNYYSLFYRTGMDSRQFLGCNMGTFDDTILGGDDTSERIVKHSVYKTNSITDSISHSEYFTTGEIACIELYTMDESSFNMWSDYQNASNLSGNFCIPYTQNIRSNINGGYGYWCGYGSSRIWTIVGN